MAKLTDKQQAFVHHYAQSLNATEAARLAGYGGNANTLAVIGHENLQKIAIKKALTSELPKAEISRVKKVAREKADRKTRPVHVYLILAENGLVKIGKTQDVEKRFSTLNNMNAVELKLLHVITTLFGDWLEEELHAQFEDKRVKGEWFALNETDISRILKDYG